MEENERELEEKKELEKELNEIKIENRNSKIIIISLIAILIILVVSLVLLFTVGNGDKKENNNKEENNTTNTDNNEKEKEDEEKEKKKEKIPRTEGKMRLFNVNGEYIEDSYCDDECRKGKDTIGIDIEYLDASLVSIYPNAKFASNVFPLFIVFKDGQKIKFFDTSVTRSFTTTLSPDYDNYEFLVNNNEIVAVVCSKDKQVDLFNASNSEYMYKGKYDSFEVLNDVYVYGIKDGKKAVLSLKEEKEVSASDAEKEKNGDFNIEKTKLDGKTYIYNIYDKNYKLIVEKKKESNFVIYENKLYVIKNNKVYQYDSEGKEGYVSNPYQNIVCLASNYIVATNNNKALIIELLSNNVVMEKDLEGRKVVEDRTGYGKMSNADSNKKVYVTLTDGKTETVFSYDPVTRKLNNN